MTPRSTPARRATSRTTRDVLAHQLGEVVAHRVDRPHPGHDTEAAAGATAVLHGGQDHLLVDPQRAGQPHGVDGEAHLGHEQGVVHQLDPLPVARRADEHDGGGVGLEQGTHLFEHGFVTADP